MSVSVTRDNEALRTDGVSVNPLTFNENLPEINVRTMTPISIEACAESGVNANELLRRPLSYFASLPALVSRPPEAAKAAQKQYEKMRVATLATVQASHARIQRKLADELSRPLAISPASGTGGAGAGGASPAGSFSPSAGVSARARAAELVRQERSHLQHQELKLKADLSSRLASAAEAARAREAAARLAAQLRADEDALRLEQRRLLIAKTRDPLLRQVVIHEATADAHTLAPAPASADAAAAATAAAAGASVGDGAAGDASPRRRRRDGGDGAVEALLAEHRLRRTAIVREELTAFNRTEMARRLEEVKGKAARAQWEREAAWRLRAAAEDAAQAERAERQRVDLERFAGALSARERLARERHEAVARKRDNAVAVKHMVAEERSALAAVKRQELDGARRADKAKHGARKQAQGAAMVAIAEAAAEEAQERVLAARAREAAAYDRLAEREAARAERVTAELQADAARARHREAVAAAARRAEEQRLEESERRRAEAEARRTAAAAERDRERDVRLAEQEFVKSLRQLSLERAHKAAAHQQQQLQARVAAETARAREEAAALASAERSVARLQQVHATRARRLAAAADRVAACEAVGALSIEVLTNPDALTADALLHAERNLKNKSRAALEERLRASAVPAHLSTAALAASPAPASATATGPAASLTSNSSSSSSNNNAAGLPHAPSTGASSHRAGAASSGAQPGAGGGKSAWERGFTEKLASADYPELSAPADTAGGAVSAPYSVRGHAGRRGEFSGGLWAADRALAPGSVAAAGADPLAEEDPAVVAAVVAAESAPGPGRGGFFSTFLATRAAGAGAVAPPSVQAGAGVRLPSVKVSARHRAVK
jgi:hypothetical protein